MRWLVRLGIAVVVLGLVVGVVGWVLTAPDPLEAAELPADHVPDVTNGEHLFHLGGCASCHAQVGTDGKEVDGKGQILLGGGLALDTPFGTFRAPNISPDPTGIGGWSDLDFANAMIRGVTPDGAHYYPAFPFDNYARMTVTDVLDLHGYLKTLPAVSNEVAGHDLSFPFNIRRAVGAWKLLYHHPGEPVVTLAGADEKVLRGQYLVEGAGHCAVCHTERTLLGGPNVDRWMAGAPGLDGPQYASNLTPANKEGIASPSAADIAFGLSSGIRPDGDIGFSGKMGQVQEDLSKLPAEDVEAIAAYLKALPVKADAER